MSIATTRAITADEFLLMPDPEDGSQTELVRGEVISMPVPGGLHGACCSRVNRTLGNFVDGNRLGHVLSNDAGFITHRDPDSVRGADVSYWSKERLKEVPVGYIDVPPDLAVEVLSPGNTTRAIREKLEEYFERGVRMVWVVSPEDRTVTIYRTLNEGRILHESATVTGEDVLPGFTCAVADLLPAKLA